MGLLILEGADGTGKTATSQHILDRADELGFAIHYKHNTESYTDYILRDLMRVINDPDSLYIWDRSYLSEDVYAVAEGRKPTISIAQMDAFISPLIDRVGIRVMLPPGANTKYSRKVRADKHLNRLAEKAGVSVYRMYERIAHGYHSYLLVYGGYHKPVSWNIRNLCVKHSYERTILDNWIMIAMMRGKLHATQYADDKVRFTDKGEKWLHRQT